ncbi:MAG: hypothetical protein WD071_06140 [Pseudohongiella sp.]|uniref:hypothetical protein n=1 Tax=Pseudohongiella sp. TaxID=1979412 RepID=UPI0034A09E3C
MRLTTNAVDSKDRPVNPLFATNPMFAAQRLPRRHRVLLVLLLFGCLLSVSRQTHAHGSVVDEGDACVIQFGFYSAHFSIFQPGTSDHDSFCEDIPSAGESVFIMEYRHDSMRQVPLEFRIMHNTSELGRFVRWQDIEAMSTEQLRADTVFLQSLPPQTDGVTRVMHNFDATGDYIGVVSIPHPSEEILYHAVFPFRVGTSAWSNWFWGLPVLALILFVIRRTRGNALKSGASHENA